MATSNINYGSQASVMLSDPQIKHVHNDCFRGEHLGETLI